MIKEFLRKIILQETIPIPTTLYYFLLKILSECKECYDGILFPLHGIAPHWHDEKFRSYFLSQSEWPDNYVDIGNYNGTYYCPNKECKHSKENHEQPFYEMDQKEGLTREHPQL